MFLINRPIISYVFQAIKIKRVCRPILFIFLFFLTVNTTLWAETTTQKYILDNGMVVLITEIPTSPAVTLQVLVKSGSTTEGKYLGCGISHFIEHIMFKGTERRKPGEIIKEIKAIGGIVDASTSFDHTSYSIESPKESFAAALDILSDMLMHSRFDPEEVKKERDVILGEIRMRKDNPDMRLNDLVFTNVYTRHPYRYPVIGYEPLFNQIARDELYGYYQANYIPNNMIFSVAGNVNTDDALNQIKKIFSDFKLKPYLTRNLPSEPVQVSERFYKEEYPTELMRISLAYPGVALSHPDLFAIDVLSMILGQGESSRLYQNIFKKKGLVYSISSESFTPMDQGVFIINCTLDQAKEKEAIATIKHEIEDLKKNGVKPQELEKAKRQALSDYLFDHQKAADIAEDVVTSEAFIGDVDFSKKYVEAIRHLTAEDIRRVANLYLQESKLSLAILSPKIKDGQKKESQSHVLPPIPIQEITLDNGMKILLHEDHLFPLVSIELAEQGGLRQEPVGLDGISNLTSMIWVNETKAKKADQLAGEIEGKGMRFNGFSGQNSFGISCDFLSEDIDFALSLLADVIRDPVFSNEEIQKAKEQIKNAILERDDNVFGIAKKNLRETLFLNLPYRKDVLGTMESVEKINRDDIVKLYTQLSSPNNMVLAVYGDFDPKKILPVLKAKFSDLKNKKVTIADYQEDPPQEMRQKNLSMDKTQAVVMIGFQAPKINEKDRYSMDELTHILGSLGGRIFKKVRDELGQSYTLGGSYTPGIDVGLVYFYVSTTNEHIDKVKEIVLSQIEELKTNDVSDKELEDTKRYLKGTFAMSLETNNTLAYITSLDELYGLGFDNYKQYGQNIDHVTKKDISEAAKKYLDTKKSAIVIIKSKEGSPAVARQ